MTIGDENCTIRSLSVSCLATFALSFHLFTRDSFKDPFHCDIILTATHLIQFIVPAFVISLGILEKYWHHQTVAVKNDMGKVVFAILIAQGMFNVPFLLFKPPTRKLCYTSSIQLEMLMVTLLAICVWLSRISLLATDSYFHFGHSSFQEFSYLYSPLAVMNTFGRIVVIFSAIHILKSKSFSKSKIAYLYLFSELIWHIFSGRREGLLLGVLSVVLTGSFIYKKVTLRQIVLFLLILVVFSSFSHYYRHSIRRQSKSGDISVLTAAVEGSENLKKQSISKTSAVIFERLNSIKFTAGCMAFFPDEKPFLNGSTYTKILWAPIPQLLFPNKPKIAYEYNAIIQPWIKGTLAPLTTVGEAYANFGWNGIWLVFLLSGVAYRIFDSSILMGTHISPLLASIWIFFSILFVRMANKPAFSGFSWMFKIVLLIIAYQVCNKLYSNRQKKSGLAK